MSLTLAIGVAIFIVVIAFLIQRRKKCYNLPPGPKPFPFIGNIHQIGDSTMALDITEMGRTYDDIFTVFFFKTPMIIMNSFKSINDLLGSSEYSEIFSERGENFTTKNVFPHGVFATKIADGQQHLRRLVLRGVKQYGTAVKRMEQVVLEELERLVVKAGEKHGHPFDPLDDIKHYTSNIILILLCGERFEPGNKILQMAGEIADDSDYLLNYKRRMVMDTVPLATKFPSDLRTAFLRIHHNKNCIIEYFTQMRKEPKHNHHECLFALLEEEYKDGKITLNNIKGIITDCILAGVMTTTNTIYTALLAMTHFPEVQMKVQEEIKRVVGSERLPNLDDKPNLPYCCATILEIFRYFTPAPIAGVRTAREDCTYQGYTIPKDTMCIYNLWHVHHDEEFWEEPFMFDPSRFLDSQGLLVKPEHENRQRLLTFGVGKRSCAGEILSRSRIFLFLTAILQNFDLQRDPSLPFPSPDPRTYHVKFITRPPDYQLRFISRGWTSNLLINENQKL